MYGYVCGWTTNVVFSLNSDDHAEFNRRPGERFVDFRIQQHDWFGGRSVIVGLESRHKG